MTDAPSRSRGLRRALSSIRLRIVAGYFLLMLGALTITVVITRQVQLARTDREIEQEQAQEVEELRLLAGGVDPETGEPFGDDVARLFSVFLSRNVPSDDEGFYSLVGGRGHLYSRGSPPLFRDPQFEPRWAAATAPTTWSTHSALGDVGEVRSLAVPVVLGGDTVGTFVVASFPDDDQREVAQVVRVISLAGLAVLLITTAVAWSIAGRIVRPVRQLSDTARSITESDLTARIPVHGHDELAQLGTTFNEMLDRIATGFAHQRRFLDDVAHELRTPITIARGHLEFLGDDPAERAETVAIVTDELDRMSRYVSDLLTLAKAEQPDFLRLQPLDLGELIIDLHQRAQALGPRSWTVDEAPPPGLFAMSADPERLTQALMNLADNAVHHTSEDDAIGLGARRVGGHVRLWVRDTGPGVDPAVAPTIFDRWARGASSRERRPEGAGIGLSIVAAIAEAHAGDVELANDPRGATFTLILPIPGEVTAPVPAVLPPPPAPVPPPPPPPVAPTKDTVP